MAKYSTNSLLFFSLFSRILIGRKVKVFEKLFALKKSLCYLFVRSNNGQSERKNRRKSGHNQSFFFSLYNTETALCRDSEFELAAQIILETGFIEDEEWN